MERSHFRIRQLLLLTLLIFFLGGCNSSGKRLAEERNALWQQNQQLRAELTRAQQDRNQAIANQNVLTQRVNELNQALANERIKPPKTKVVRVEVPVAAPQKTAFDNIDGIETEKRADRIIVRVPGDVLFSPGKVDLKSTSKRTLAQIAGVIRRDYNGKLIRVEGYTDTDPIRRSQWKDNLQLSMERSAAVHRYLQSQGLDARRMYAAGFGPNQPRATKAKSRRVEIVVVLDEQLASGR